MVVQLARPRKGRLARVAVGFGLTALIAVLCGCAPLRVTSPMAVAGVVVLSLDGGNWFGNVTSGLIRFVESRALSIPRVGELC
jgi:cytosine/uracil/thiamine/allantoin permease